MENLLLWCEEWEPAACCFVSVLEECTTSRWVDGLLLMVISNHLQGRAWMVSPKDGIWSKKERIGLQLEWRDKKGFLGQVAVLGNKTSILVTGHSVQHLYCYCWFAPLIPDGTADPTAAVAGLLWMPWSYLTPLCRQVPCHPAKPHWLPVQRAAGTHADGESFSISSSTFLSRLPAGGWVRSIL